MKKLGMITFDIMFVLFMATALFAAEGSNVKTNIKQDGPKGCVELVERLEIENKARGQFSCDINSYKPIVNDPRDKIGKIQRETLK